jgi:hypothetical protein
VDWVGTGPNGRSDEDNRRIIKSFCPDKDSRGRREWTLDVLVQRGIAAEGLDSVDVSELVFLCPVNGTVQDMQFMGRGSRLMRDAAGRIVEVTATINVDSATSIAMDGTYLGHNIMSLFDSDSAPEDAPEEEEPSDDPEPHDPDETFLPEDPIVVLADVSLINVRTEEGYEEVFNALKEEAPHKSDDELHAIGEAVLRRHIQQRDEGLNASSINAQLRTQINTAVSKIVSRLMRRMLRTGLRPERGVAGDLTKRIRQRAVAMFGKLDTLDERELREQYQWLVGLEQDIALGNREKVTWLL